MVYKSYISLSSLLNLAPQITPSANESEYAKVHIPLALMRYRDFVDAQQVSDNKHSLLFYKMAYQVFTLTEA